jgi:hypothetical protein
VRVYAVVITADTWTRTRGFLECPGEKGELAYEFLYAKRQIVNYKPVTSP